MPGIRASTAALSAFLPAAAANTAAGAAASAAVETVPCTNSRLLRLRSPASAMRCSPQQWIAFEAANTSTDARALAQPTRGTVATGQAVSELDHHACPPDHFTRAQIRKPDTAFVCAPVGRD